jgi:hypothetical protein
MHKLVRLATLAFPFLLLASCGGNGQQAQAPVAIPAPAVPSTPPAVDSAAYENLVQQLYIAYFGRPADPAGLASDAQSLSAANAPKTIDGLYAAYSSDLSVRTLVASFANSRESIQLYKTGSNLAHGMVHTVYDNLFSHAPDAAGADYWAGLQKDGRVNGANLPLAILASAKGGDAELMARKVRAAILLTRAVDAAGQRAMYDSPLGRLVVGAMIRSMPSMQDDSAIRASVDDVTSRLSALSSGSFVEAPRAVRKIVLLATADQLATNGARVTALADVLASDLNSLRPGGPTWTVSIVTAAGTVPSIREQLRPYDSAILIGRVPVATSNGAPQLDVYRLPGCPLLQVADTGDLINSPVVDIDPRCKYGLVISILRGQSPLTDSSDVARKLDQMIAYHKASSVMNSSWARRLRYIEAAWFGGTDAHQAGMSDAWTGMAMFLSNAINYLDEGTSAQRRDAFLDCITNNNEICGANLHGAAQFVQFEGPGTPGTLYSSDSLDWSPATLPGQSVKAKYITLDSCSTQNFLYDRSAGTTLLMNGNALLTRGTVEPTWINNHHEEDVIRSEYGMLQNGSTFAEALYGRMEMTTESVQGDPYITMRPVPLGPQPRLVIDGTHYGSGAVVMPVSLPDSVNGSNLSRVVTYSNRGDADLHLRLGLVPGRGGVDTGSSRGYQRVDTNGSIFFVEYTQTFSDGRVLNWPGFELETYGGAMHATLKPGQSVAVTYRLTTPVGADGTPQLLGQYVWEVVNTSDDPASGRVIMALTARAR